MTTQNSLITYSIRQNCHGRWQACTARTIREFAAHLAGLRANNSISPKTGTDDKDGWMVYAPLIDPGKTCKVENCAPRSWIMLDLDLQDRQGKRLPLDAERLRRWLGSVNSLLWQTHSYKPEWPKCRVCLFLDRDVSREPMAVGTEQVAEYTLAVRGAVAMLRDYGAVDLFGQEDQSFEGIQQGMYTLPAGRAYLAVTDEADYLNADLLVEKGKTETLTRQAMQAAENAARSRQIAQYAHATAPAIPVAGSALEKQAQAIFAAQLSALESTPPGSRHAACLRTAQTIGGLVGGGYIHEGQARSALLSVAQAISENGEDQRDFERAVLDGLKHGALAPIDLANDPQWKRQTRRASYRPEEYAPPAEDPPEWMDVDTPEPAPEHARPFTLLDGLRGLSEYLTSRGGRKLRTGIATLDRSTDGGLACGLHVIGGLPGSGKSALALEIALNVVKAGGRVLYLSLEMDRYEVAKRVAQRVWFDETGNTITERGLVDLARQNGKAMDDTLLRGDALWHTQADALEVGDLETLGGGDIDCICQEIAAFRERCAGGKHLPLVIVDYLQYVGSKHNRAQDRRVLLVEIAQKLKAQTLQGEGCVVLGLSSINRDAYYDTPSLEMLKEAGEVEYTAQTVHILGYRFRDYPNREAVRSFVQEHKDDATRHYALYCMKNRGGAPHDAWIDFDAAAMTVSPADNPNPYPAVGTMLPAEKQGKAARKQTKTQLPEA